MPQALLSDVRHLIGLASLGAALAAGPVTALERLEFTVAQDDKELTETLRNASILVTSELENQTDPQDLFAAAQADYAQLLGTLYSAGHYSATIRILLDGREAANIAALDAPRQINVIEIVIDPGPSFRFSHAKIAPLTAGTELPPEFATGKIASSVTIHETTKAGVDGWRALGHAKADVAAQNITVDHKSAELSARINLAPGPKLRFGPLVVKGQKKMRIERIRAIAGLPTGETFDPKELELAANRLRRTGVFESVTLKEADGITPPNFLPITATIVEEKKRRYSLGSEISSLDGIDMTGYWMHRNLLDDAERLKVYGEMTNIGAQSSGIDYKLGVTLDRPATFTPDTTLGIISEVGLINDSDYTENFATAGLTATQIFSPKLTAHTSLTFKYSNGRDGVSDFQFRNLSIPVGVKWDRRDDQVSATKGYYINLEVKPFLSFDNTDSGVRLTWDARNYKGFESNNFVLAGRIQGGAIYGSRLLATPRDELFYSGGGGTVRGQPYQSLGINLLEIFDRPSRIGGTFFIGSQVEARVRITEKMGVVGFFDYGQIAINSFFNNFGKSHSGAGLGLRYDTGIGPIRLDVAKPIGDNKDKNVQIYVGLRQAF
ncbi:MAG: BamA/TamA family outer membrane protein [Rhodobacteraceae bacterium]|nr:BamA/TamA family outer membrane protein [Paracoccaceae bacterium]